MSRASVRAVTAFVLLALLSGGTTALVLHLARAGHAREAVLDSEQGPDFDQVYADARPVSSLGAAGATVAFPLVAPAPFNAPTAIYVHAGITTTLLQGAALVYDDPTYGRFVVREEPVVLTQADLEQIPDECHASSDCEGTWDVVTLDDGTRAVLVSGDNSTSVTFLRGQARVVVIGPPDTFSVADAETVASIFAAA